MGRVWRTCCAVANHLDDEWCVRHGALGQEFLISLRTSRLRALAPVERRLRDLGATPVLLVGSIAAAGFSYVSIALSARLLGPADFGVLGTLLAVTSVAGVLLRPMHMLATHVAGDAYARGMRRAIVPMTTAVHLFAAVIGLLLLSLALGFPLQSALRIDSFAPLALMGLMIVSITVSQIASGFLIGLHRFHMFAVLTIAEASGRALLTAPLVYLFGVSGSIAAYVTATIATAVVTLHQVGGLSQPSVAKPPVWSEVAGIAQSTLVLTLAVAIIQHVDLVALRTYASPEDVGLYAATAVLGNLGISLAAALYLPFYPRVLAASRRGASTLPHLRKILLQMTAAGLVSIVVSIPLGSWIVGVLLGPQLADRRITPARVSGQDDCAVDPIPGGPIRTCIRTQVRWRGVHGTCSRGRRDSLLRRSTAPARPHRRTLRSFGWRRLARLGSRRFT